MLKKSNMHQYQIDAVNFAKEKKKCGLFLDMGLGKTVSALTVAADLLGENKIKRVLIIAPLRVANTVWKQEAQNWEHLNHLTIAICTGSPAARLNAVNDNAQIHVINRENIPWLVDNCKWVWDMVIVDESSSFKSAKSKRFKALRKANKLITHCILLTGTPTPKSPMDLWAQIFLIDSGKRLGRTMTMFRNKYFNQVGYMGYDYALKPNAKDFILKSISDVCMTMKAEDYLQLPEKINIKNAIQLPTKALAQYKEIEKEFLLSLDNDVNIESPSAAALANKLLQICNGAIYDEDKNTHILHDAKIEALIELLEDNPEDNILVAYNFKSDLDRIRKAIPEAVLLSKSGNELIEWNKGNIRVLLAHPMSAAMGLNAQKGGSIIAWFGLNWSLELYQQFNARLHRQGQDKPVRVVHLVAQGCIDEKVMLALDNKAANQNELIEYLKYK